MTVRCLGGRPQRFSVQVQKLHARCIVLSFYTEVVCSADHLSPCTLSYPLPQTKLVTQLLHPSMLPTLLGQVASSWRRL